MTSRLRRAPALLLAIVLCLAAIHAWWPAPAPPSSPGPAAPEAPATVEAVPAPVAEAAAPTAPPAGAITRRRDGKGTLADIAPILQARADAGDAHAACHLGIGLLQCGLLGPYSAQYMDRLAASEQRHDQAGRWEDADNDAGLLLRLTELRNQCDGIPPSLVEAGGDYLRKAALAGHPEALVRYLRGEGLGVGFDFLRRPAFEQWRREAPILLAREFDRGNASAVLVALTSHARDFGTLSNITPPDPDAAATTLALARRLFGERAEHIAGRLSLPTDADRLAQAETRAAELHERLFAGEIREFEEAAHSLVPLYDLHGGASWPLPGALVDLDTACRGRGTP